MPPLDPRTNVFHEMPVMQFRRARQASAKLHDAPLLRWRDASLGAKVATLAVVAALGGWATVAAVPVIVAISALFSR